MKKFTTRILPIGLLLMFFFSFNSYAQQRNITLLGDPVAVTGHLIRTTPKLADIDKNSMYGKPLVITRDKDGVIGKGKHMEETEERLEEEMIDKLNKEYRNAIKDNKTEAIQSPGVINPNTPGTSLGVDFNGQTSPGLQPTDNNMAAGPNHIIQIVNNLSGSQFTIWNKAGVVVQGPTTLASITGVSGQGDPIVLYDQLADRWFMAEFGSTGGNPNYLVMAVSVTPNPTGAWKIYQYIDVTFYPDYPKFSVWHNAYYAYTNDFNPGGTAFLGTSVWAFDRAAMLAGAATSQMVRQRLSLSNMIAMGSVGLEGMIPSSQNGLFVVPSSATQLDIFEVTPNFPAATITVGPLTALPVPAWSASGAIAQQTGGTLGSLSPRMMFKLSYRNNGGTESIVTAHTIANGGLGQVRWYELRRVAAVWTVFQQGNVAGTDGNSRWMPGISMDGCGNIALMYDVAGTGTPPAHPSIRYTGRNSSDPVNTMTLPESVIINGATNFGGFRWGDYNTTVQDYSGAGVPANNSFWSTSQYANQQTRITNFSLTGGCAAAPVITAGTATLTAEGCVPNNGVIDPGETVTVSFCVTNSGTAPTVNLVGTMQATGGVTPISGPQNYGVVVNGGPAVCRSFSFSNTSGTCGGTITVSIQMQDGATNLGTVTWTFTLGTTVVSSSENFDAVVAPALPAGWVATNPAGGGALWVTSNAGTPAPPAVSLPNAIFIDDPGLISDKQIVTPSFVPGSGARVSFANNYSLESTFDGGVLEISINGGAYQDIITAGGSFVTGGYVGVISSAFGSPIAGRNAWTGASGAFITTTVNMPPASAGQPCTLKFRMASDNSVAAVGWRVDNFSVSQPACCGAACTITCPANITANTGPGATTCGANVVYPPATTTGLCGLVTYSNPSGSFFPKGTTVVTATTAAGPSCNFTVTVVDNTPPTITCPANITANNTPGLCSAVVTYPLPTVTDNCGLPGPITLTQTASQVPVAGSVACNAGGFHTLNSYFRAYNLGPLALPGPVQINSVQFGIELADANGTGTTQPVTVNVYTSSTVFPAGYPASLTLVGTSGVIQIPDQTLSTFTANMLVPPTVPANARLVLELVTPDGRAPANNRFFIGSNTSAQTGPSYIMAADCGIATPTDLTAIGFPNMHIILNAIGLITGPSPLTQIAGLPSGATYPVGVTTNTFRATDIAGNTSTCSFTVTVVDNQAPALTCPANIIRNTDPNVCFSTFTPPVPTFSDNCAVSSLTWVMTGATTGSSAASGINTVPSTAFGLTGQTGQGITTITYTAKDAAGNTTVCSFTVTVNDASIPVISGQPSNQFVCVGSDGAFTVVATAGAGNPLTYQWQAWNGTAWVNITGATAATLPLPAVTFSMNTNSYRVILTGRCSIVTSGFATLYVNPLPIVSVLASRPLALLPGQFLTLTAVVSPGGGTYQWFKNGVAIPGATGSSLNNLTVDNIGTYTVRYTDPNGCVTTSAAMTVTGEPSCKMWVYENPNRGIFQVRFFNATNEPVTVNIYNSGGAKVYSRAVTTGLAFTRIDVDISNEGAGVYTVEIINSTGKRGCVGPRKFVKVY